MPIQISLNLNNVRSSYLQYRSYIKCLYDNSVDFLSEQPNSILSGELKNYQKFLIEI